MDHVIPFFHLDPLKGGLTRFGNLHPLCKKHHALKTAGRLGVTMPDSWQLDYDFRHGISATVSPPDQPINIAQALEFAALADMRPERWRLPEQMAQRARRAAVLHRTASAEDIAEQVLTFCRADSVTGQVVAVDGGSPAGMR